jgi:hypothetical protein
MVALGASNRVIRFRTPSGKYEGEDGKTKTKRGGIMADVKAFSGIGIHSGELFLDAEDGMTYETVKMTGATAGIEPDTPPTVMLVFCACTPPVSAAKKRGGGAAAAAGVAPAKKRGKPKKGGKRKTTTSSTPRLIVVKGKLLPEILEELKALRTEHIAVINTSDKYKKFFSSQVQPALHEARTGSADALKQFQYIFGQLYRDLTGHEWDDGVATERAQLEAEEEARLAEEDPGDDDDIVDLEGEEMEAVDIPQQQDESDKPPKKKAAAPAPTKKAKQAIGEEMEQAESPKVRKDDDGV